MKTDFLAQLILVYQSYINSDDMKCNMRSVESVAGCKHVDSVVVNSKGHKRLNTGQPIIRNNEEEW